MNVDSSLLAAHLATSLLKEKGHVILTGAYRIYKSPSAEIMSYTLSKNMVHSIAYNFAKASSLPTGASVITILPYCPLTQRPHGHAREPQLRARGRVEELPTP